MIDAVMSWPALLAALVVFGFAPGALLRLIVLAFHRDDPRRRELLAELYAVPRLERPFWVMQQLEVALFEGVCERIVWAATGRIIHRWRLSSGVERHLAHPETFWIPPLEERLAVDPGATVQLAFEMKDGWGERMWVHVTHTKRRHLVGRLLNEPAGIPRLSYGDKVKFQRDDIINVVTPERPPRSDGAEGVLPVCDCCNQPTIDFANLPD